MSNLYNSNITTRFIDPVFDKKLFRSEYRLQPDTVYLGNLRLAGLGIEANAATQYNALVGAYGCIKSIQLYDGNQLLSQLNEASIYTAFKNVKHDNDTNLSMNALLNNNSLGYIASGNQSYDATTGRPGPDDVKIGPQSSYNNTDNKAWLSVGSLLPFLAKSFYLPTNVFKRLRLVVNWKSAAALTDMVKDRSATVTTYDNVTLIVDEMNMSPQRDQMMKGYQGLVWTEVEHDSVDLPEVTGVPADGEKVQQNSFLVNGFNGKKVQKLLLVQSPTDQSTWVDGTDNTEFSNQGSKALKDAKYQIRVNGANKIPRANWEGSNRRLAHLVDAYGECNVVLGQNVTYLAEGANYLEDSDTLGQLDYTGLIIDEDVNEMIVSIDRTAVAGNAGLNQRIRLNLFGEVEKAVIVKSNEEFNVVYTQ